MPESTSQICFMLLFPQSTIYLKSVRSIHSPFLYKGFLNYPFLGHQTMQLDGNLQSFTWKTNMCCLGWCQKKKAPCFPICTNQRTWASWPQLNDFFSGTNWPCGHVVVMPNSHAWWRWSVQLSPGGKLRKGLVEECLTSRAGWNGWNGSRSLQVASCRGQLVQGGRMVWWKHRRNNRFGNLDQVMPVVFDVREN